MTIPPFPTDRPIETEADYDRAIAILDDHFRHSSDSDESPDIDRLFDLVEAYEAIHYPIPDVSPSDMPNLLEDSE